MCLFWGGVLTGMMHLYNVIMIVDERGGFMIITLLGGVVYDRFWFACNVV